MFPKHYSINFRRILEYISCRTNPFIFLFLRRILSVFCYFLVFPLKVAHASTKYGNIYIYNKNSQNLKLNPTVWEDYKGRKKKGGKFQFFSPFCVNPICDAMASEITLSFFFPFFFCWWETIEEINLGSYFMRGKMGLVGIGGKRKIGRQQAAEEKIDLPINLSKNAFIREDPKWPRAGKQ